MGTRWRIELLGGLRAMHGERELTRFRTQKTGVLLAYLAYHPQRTHPRDSLIELLWPEADLQAGSNSLSQALSSLRRELEPRGTPAGTVIVASRAAVRMNPSAISTDVAEFGAALHAAAAARSDAERVHALTQAVECYRGELLTGYYAIWVLEQREWLAEAYFQGLGQLLALLEKAGDLPRALDYARRAVLADPLREEARRDLMRLYAAVGQPDAALRQYRELECLLKHQLGATPDAVTRALAREIDASIGAGPGAPGRGLRVISSLESDPAELSKPSAERWSEAKVVAWGKLEPVGGAVPLESGFYVVRPTDREFRSAIARHDSIVLVKGARQMGKTSLLARGLQQAREGGASVVLTDFQRLTTRHLASAERFFRMLADWLAVQLDLGVSPHEHWLPGCGPALNFELFVRRELLGKIAAPIVWGLDDLDRLFTCDFGCEVFSLFRSWHNARSFEPTGPWARLTLAISYATEAHLFLTDMGQSPFNVGTRLVLEDLTLEQVADLNDRYGSPLQDDGEIARFFRLVSGHPDLVRRGLHAMATRGIGIAGVEAEADRDGGIFDDHLRRLLVLVARDPNLCEVVRSVLQGRPCPTAESFYRLRSAGIIVGGSTRDVRPHCQLYATYLGRHLP